MKKMKLCLLALALALSLPAPARAADIFAATLMRNFDVTTGGYTYAVFGDQNSLLAGNPLTGALGPGTAKNIAVTTSGSSTTVAAVTAGTAPFLGIGVGDLLIFPRVWGTPGVPAFEAERVVSAKASNDSITVDTAIQLDQLANAITGGSATFRYKKLRTGTGAGDAWFSVEGFDNFNIQFDVNTINATSLTATLECRVSKYAAANTLYETVPFTTTGAKAISVNVRQEECRVGWKISGDAGAQVVAAYFMGSKVQ